MLVAVFVWLLFWWIFRRKKVLLHQPKPIMDLKIAVSARAGIRLYLKPVTRNQLLIRTRVWRNTNLTVQDPQVSWNLVSFSMYFVWCISFLWISFHDYFPRESGWSSIHAMNKCVKFGNFYVVCIKKQDFIPVK